jgi:hypothetical protein
MAMIQVQGIPIAVYAENEMDFISLTDMLKAKDGDFFISDWLRNRNTVEFLGIWERVHNPEFNYGGFAAITSRVGLNNYKLSVKEWVAQTNAIGLVARAGRYGGTYAHKDIAFEFGMWISAEFKIYLIKEFQRLKETEHQQLGWDIRRNLTRINYRIHTDAWAARHAGANIWADSSVTYLDPCTNSFRSSCAPRNASSCAKSQDPGRPLHHPAPSESCHPVRSESCHPARSRRTQDASSTQCTTQS